MPSRVILIDDDEDDAYLFRLALESLSQQVELMHINDSELAIKTLSDPTFRPPDFLFLDWNMPKLDGGQCLVLIRSLPGYATVPIVVLSTAEDDEIKSVARELGATYFILKPPNIEELTVKLDVLFKSYETKLNAQ
ncbi:response regulator receiver protein [Niastella koreensis GR20-10]|uniref:Response regulator receiver protein n=2 Tax=Niastella koreensis TaxID=354356 RepID=G8TRF8_NIAKG|nr:response regulator receiver protein [Niastella koreensis GR20-10]